MGIKKRSVLIPWEISNPSVSLKLIFFTYQVASHDGKIQGLTWKTFKNLTVERILGRNIIPSDSSIDNRVRGGLRYFFLTVELPSSYMNKCKINSLPRVTFLFFLSATLLTLIKCVLYSLCFSWMQRKCIIVYNFLFPKSVGFSDVKLYIIHVFET